jgi:NDP-sugar pyrophosphorylase family protein
MSAYTKDTPKALIPVAGIPFIHHQLDLLEKQGFTNIVFSIGYLGSQIIEELRLNPHPNISVSFVSDGDVLRGTGGAVRIILETEIFDDYFFVTYGDSYLIFNPAELGKSLDSARFDAIMALYTNKELLEPNNVRFNNGTASYMKNCSDSELHHLNMIDFGISYISRASVLKVIPENQKYDLSKYFEDVSREGRLQGMVTSQRFYEIGSPSGRNELEKLLDK